MTDVLHELPDFDEVSSCEWIVKQNLGVLTLLRRHSTFRGTLSIM